MGTVIGVFSGKGGVGKTTLVANLATSLTKNFNKKVVVLDSNFSTSHLGLHFGLYEDPKVTIREVISKKLSPTTAFFIHPSTGVRLIPAALRGTVDDTTTKGLDNVVRQLREDNDVVIVDAAPGLGREVLAAMKSVDEALIVATPDLPSVSDAMKTANLIKKIDGRINVLGVIMNRVKNEKYELTRKEVESASNLDSITQIPEDGRIPESIAKGIPVTELYPNANASVAFNRLSAALIGQAYEPKGFTYALKKMLGIVKTKDEFVNMPARKNKEPMKADAKFSKIAREKLGAAKTGTGRARNSEMKSRLNMKIKQKLKERGIDYGSQ